MLRRSFGKKIVGFILALCMAIPAFSFPVAVTAVTTDDSPSQSAKDYGLMDTTQEGLILHAWDWSFNNIKANMERIARAGFTSVQVSPIQQAKEATYGRPNEMWWILYQPCCFQIDDTGNSALGTKADFEAMCAEAHKYGIHVIVDVVANHLGNQGGYDKSYAIPPDIREDDECWHPEGFRDINYGDRYSITHGSISGLPDLNTENPKIQNYVKGFLRECIDAGADGFRFDAAKHIGLPSEGSDFWPNVLNDARSYYSDKGAFGELYAYGEILNETGGPSISEYTQLMSVTDNQTGNDIRKNVAGHNAAGAASSNYKKGAAADKTVLWAESHDTYQNAERESTDVSDSDINKTWALVASRNDATALYYARTDGYRNGMMGDVISTQCFSDEVSAINAFHNFFNGQSEHIESSEGIAYNERGTSGVILVNCKGDSANVDVKAYQMADGVYTDQISGNSFTVSGGRIKGQIGSTGIAVVYGAINMPFVKVSLNSGTYMAAKDDALSVDLSLVNATEGTYSINNGPEIKFTEDTTLTLGKGVDYGVEIKLTVTAYDENGPAQPQNYTYIKSDPDAVQRIYFDNKSYGWDEVYVYVYYSGSTFFENNNWPGIKMTLDEATGYYVYEVPESLKFGLAMFSDGTDNPEKRYPANQEPGLELNGNSMIFSENHNWDIYDPYHETDPKRYMLGDIDGNEKINLLDALYTQKYALGLYDMSEIQLLAANVDNSSSIDLLDAIYIQKYALNDKSGLPIGEWRTA